MIGDPMRRARDRAFDHGGDAGLRSLERMDAFQRIDELRAKGQAMSAGAQQRFELNREAWALLDMINAEFQTDPMSVQCFDRRVVDRVLDALRRRWEIDQKSDQPMLDHAPIDRQG